MSTLPHRNHYSRKPVGCRSKAKLGRRNPENRKRRSRRRKSCTTASKDTVHPSLRLPERTLKQGKNTRRVHGLCGNSQLHAEGRKKLHGQLAQIENVPLSLEDSRIEQTGTSVLIHGSSHREDSPPAVDGLQMGVLAGEQMLTWSRLVSEVMCELKKYSG